MVLMLERRQRRSAYLGGDVNGWHKQVWSDTGRWLGRPLSVVVVLQVSGHHDFGLRFGCQRAVPYANRHLFDGHGSGIRIRVSHFFGFPCGVLLLHPCGHRDGVWRLHRSVAAHFFVSSDGGGHGRLPSCGRSEFASDCVQDTRHSVRLVVRKPDNGEHGPGHQTAAAHQWRRSLQLMSTAVVVVQMTGVGLQSAFGRLRLQQSERRRRTTVTATTVATTSGRTSNGWVPPPQGLSAYVTVVVVVRLFFGAPWRRRWCRRPRDSVTTSV